MKKTIAVTISCAVILATSVWFYFNEYKYKNNFIVAGAMVLLVFFGWFFLFYCLKKRNAVPGSKRTISEILFGTKEEQQQSRENRMEVLRQKKRYVRMVIVPMILLVLGNLAAVFLLSWQRDQRVLSTGETRQAEAVVTRLEDRWEGRRGDLFKTNPYAIIHYRAADKEIEQSIANNGFPVYNLGQRVLIRYAVDYPELFEVIRDTE